MLNRIIPNQTRDKDNPMSGFAELLAMDQQQAIFDLDPIERPLPSD